MLQLQIEKILKNRSLTLTSIRKKVLKTFLQHAKPLSLKQIKLLIKNIDRVTLFRILSVFEKNKIIHTINLDKGEKLYALCSQECKQEEHDHSHIHFKCDDCQDVSCLPVDKFPTLSVPSYVVNALSINATGICPNCTL